MEFEMMVNNDEEQQLLFSHLNPKMRVLEFGSGSSTLAIAKRVKRLISVEHNEGFYKSTLKTLQDNQIKNVGLFHVPANAEPIGPDDGTAEGFADYIALPMKYAANEKFDLIFIDGRARVACAKVSVDNYLKPGGIIFIHDYGHPKEEYRRPEYEVVEEFLTLEKKEFTMAKFSVKKKEVAPVINSVKAQTLSAPQIPGGVRVWDGSEEDEVPAAVINNSIREGANEYIALKEANVASAIESLVDESTCWYNDYCVEEMNRFYDIHIKNHDLTKHLGAFTRLLSLTDESGCQVIDLGCGTAMLSDFCKGHEYIGADLPHIISGCAMRNYPNNMYRSCDLTKDSLDFISNYKIVVANGVIDIMEHPLQVLASILKKAPQYVIIHRQEITENGNTHTIKNGSYGGLTYHSIISRKDWMDCLEEHGFELRFEEKLEFGNWENGGCSFLLRKRKSWALNNIDFKINKLFEGKRDGFFIEAGANDGLTQSNTMYLEFYKNWKGILIEPIPDVYEKCGNNRSPETIIVNAALVSNYYKQGTIKMLHTPECRGMLSSVDDATGRDLIERRSKEKPISVIVPAMTLNNIINSEAQNKDIDILILDVEGYELNALEGLDLEKCNIEYMLIEMLVYNILIIEKLEPYYELVDTFSEHDYLFKRK